MKKIRFYNLKNFSNITTNILIIIASVLFLLNLLELLHIESPVWRKIVNVFPFLMMFIYYSKMFWFRNFVEWNKRGIMIKVNNFWGKTFNFSDVKNFHIENKVLEIIKEDSTKKYINLDGICPDSIQKLEKILAKYIIHQ